MKRHISIELIAFLLLLLFLYASFNKIIDYQQFKIQIGQSPILTGFGDHLPWLVITAELVVSVLLVFPKFRLIAFLGSFCLLTTFTVYIFSILTFSDFVPCSCGGVLENLGWTEHLLFNIVFVGLTLAGIILQSSDDQKMAIP